MELITNAAYLSVCKNCGGHAQIKISEKIFSKPFLSKEEGRRVVAELLELTMINEFEKMHLLSGIDTCELPSSLDPDDPTIELLEALMTQAGHTTC